LLDWIPPQLATEMYENGVKSWPEVKAAVGV
jgi:hypothetical protein